MRIRRAAVRLLVVALAASTAGCTNPDTPNAGTAGEQLATFAVDFFRQALAAFLL